MKALKYLGTASLAAYAVFVLAACNGTSNGSTGSTASTTTATTTTCTTGVNPYTGAACTIGSIISTGTTVGTIGTIGTGTGAYTAPVGYPYGSNPTGSTNCQIYYYQYGVPYVPMYYNGQLVCANYYDLIGSISSSYYGGYTNSNYSNNLDYWYQYPPYGGSSNYGYGGSNYAYLSGGYANNFNSGGSGFYLNFGISF